MTSRPLGCRQTPVCDTPANLREQTDCGTPASHGRDDGTDTLQNQRMRLARRWRRRRSYPRGHHYGEPDPGTGPECLLEVIQPGYILLLTALDRMGRDTLGLFRWSGRGSAGVGHAGPCQGGGGGQSTDAGGGVGAAKGNTSGQCWIVPQAWIRTVRSKRNVPSLPVHGLTCKLCRCRFPRHLLDARVSLRSGQIRIFCSGGCTRRM